MRIELQKNQIIDENGDCICPFLCSTSYNYYCTILSGDCYCTNSRVECPILSGKSVDVTLVGDVALITGIAKAGEIEK